MMVRGMHMIPFYGCGVGLASAMMSRVYAVTMPVHPAAEDADHAGHLAGRHGRASSSYSKRCGLGYNPQLNPLEDKQRIHIG